MRATLTCASAIRFYHVTNDTLQLIRKHQQVTQGFPSSVYYAHSHAIAPALGVLKAHYDSVFIFYLQPSSRLSK